MRELRAYYDRCSKRIIGVQDGLIWRHECFHYRQDIDGTLSRWDSVRSNGIPLAVVMLGLDYGHIGALIGIIVIFTELYIETSAWVYAFGSSDNDADMMLKKWGYKEV